MGVWDRMISWSYSSELHTHTHTHTHMHPRDHTSILAIASDRGRQRNRRVILRFHVRAKLGEVQSHTDPSSVYPNQEADSEKHHGSICVYVCVSLGVWAHPQASSLLQLRHVRSGICLIWIEMDVSLVQRYVSHMSRMSHTHTHTCTDGQMDA